MSKKGDKLMGLSIIHFSDIHIKAKTDKILKRIDFLKAACVSALPNNGNVVIAISGDIAFSGKPEQYELARSLLDHIVEYIKNEKDSIVDIVCVPGNHDCDFDKDTYIRTKLIDSAKPSEIDDEYYNTVNVVQNEYNSFAGLYDIDTNCILPRKEVEVGGFKVIFALPNTAWMSNLKEQIGKIVIPQQLFEPIDSKTYKIVFYMFHHPENWLNPEYKRDFIDNIRENADMLLLGHEHLRDNYEKTGDSFSVFCNHGKELQDSYSDDSAFSVINFDNAFQTFEIIDFKWNGTIYDRQEVYKNQYHKNIASNQSVFHPNKETIDMAEDIGIYINHFAKENVTLSDLFVWPDISKNDYYNDKNKSTIIRKNVIEELADSNLNILVGASSGGKTAIAKKMFLLEEPKDSCCLLLNGKEFTASDESQIRSVIESCFVTQYSKDCLEKFNQLPKFKRTVIVDDFDFIKLNKDRRKCVLDYLCGFFGNITVFLSSSIELSTILTSDYIKSLDKFIYYQILPLGNKKMKELISKWYHLNESTLTDDEIEERIENARKQIDIFLGNGAAFIPAIPVFIIGTLQNGDAIKKTMDGSKYGFLYKSLVDSCLAKVASNYSKPGMYNIDESILSKLAFNSLKLGRTSFTEEQILEVTSEIEDKYILQLSNKEFLDKMINAKIIRRDISGGEVYRFKYPYIFYYFAGRYIAYNLKEKDVQEMVECMSAKLYNETYGNIIIFVCHFSGSSEVIDNVLLNAYATLDSYQPFDFGKKNPIFNEIKDAIEALIPSTIANNENVTVNKEKALIHLDEIGINDGIVNDGEDIIEDEITEKEREMASVISALKTIEVLGQILQNYPVAIEGTEKIEIINEMHKLGMRSIEAIIKTMGYLEKELIEYIIERAKNEKKNILREDVERETHRFINILISGMSQGMVHQVAVSLNSEHILPVARQTLESDQSISSKLILVDLKMNCLNKFSYGEIQGLKKAFNSTNETFASRILDSIIAQYLNYNKCDKGLRAKLCNLCGFSEQQTFLSQQKNLLN